MTIVGEAFIEIRPVDKGFEAKVVATANAAAKKAAGALVIPATADADKLDDSVVAAAKAAARKAAGELDEIPAEVDTAEFARSTQDAAQVAARRAAGELDAIPAGLDVSALEADAANAAARAATAAGGRLDDIPLGADGEPLVRDVDQAMDRAERRVDDGARRMHSDTSSALGGLGGLVAKSFAAIGVGQLIFGGIQEQREAAATARQTEAVIRSTGGAANVTSASIGKLADNLQAKVAVDGDAIRAGANLLLTFTNVRNEVGKGNDVFNQATGVLVDMAAALGTDVSAGAIQLGKALNDPIAGVAALAEVGVTFTAQQKEQIKAMVEAGDTAQAQKVILAELRKEFGGSAAAQADDLDRLALKYGDFREKVGAAALRVVGVLSDIPAPLQATAAGLVGLAVAAVGINTVVTAVSSLRTALAASSLASAGLTSAVAGLGLLAGGLAAVAVAGTAFSKFQAGAAPKVAELANALVLYGQGAKAAGELTDEFGVGIDDLAGKLKAISDDTKGLSKFELIDPSDVRDAKRDIDALDKILANLVATGKGELAETILTRLAKDAGVAVPEVTKRLDDYKGALANVDTQQRLTNASAADLAPGLAELGAVSVDTAGNIDKQAEAAKEAADALDIFKSALDAAIGVQVNAERAAIDYIDTVQALRDSVTEHGKTLDLNSGAGRRNREAILSVVEGARAHIEAMADEGATAGELNATFATHRGELARVLSQLGFNKAEASGYLGLLDAVPQSVFTQLALDNSIAEQKLAALKLSASPIKGILDLDTKPASEKVTALVTAIKADLSLVLAQRPTGREHGGPVYRGQGYIVGERRPEWFEPDRNGWVFPTVPKAANGAIVAATPGGTLVQVAEAGRAEAIIPLTPGLVSALERLGEGTSTALFRDLVVQAPSAGVGYAVGMEAVRQLRGAQYARSGK